MFKTFINKLSQKEKIGLFIGIVFLSLALLDRLIINPINYRIQLINRDVKVNEKQLTMALRNLSQKEAITKEYQKYSRYQKSAGSDEEQTASILSEVEAIARESGISLVDMKPQQSKNIDFYKEYRIDIEAKGTMEQIINFLYKLNVSPQLLRAEKLTLNPEGKDSALIKASIIVTKISLL